MSNQGNMTPPKETHKTLVMYTKEIEVYGLSAEQVIIILFKKFSERQRTK